MDNLHISVLLLLGVGIFGGTLGAVFFQAIRIPQVLGYIVIGIIIGQMGLNIIKPEDISKLAAFNWFALGIIGFLVGGELRSDNFRKYGRKYVALVLGEGLGAFLLVGASVTAIVYFVSGSFHAALAAGVVFGAISSATDPASTVDVLWENRAAGLLTTALTAVVALDDALAMTLYGLGTSVAQALTGNNETYVIRELLFVGIELFGSVALGFGAGALLTFILKRFNQSIERLLALAVGIILLAVGIADVTGLDIILAAMAAGVTVVNLAPGRSEQLYHSIKGFSVPIYAMFFVLLGARFSLSNIPEWLWVIIVIYAVGRSFGKVGGAWLAARASKTEPVVRKYLGLGLFAQGGVAVGLSIVAGQHLTNVMVTDGMSLGNMIIFAVTATTFIVQLLGPAMVKLAVKLADESGRNVTRDDIIESMKVVDVMDTDIVTVRKNEPVDNIIKLFSRRHFPSYPVVDDDNKLIGVLTLENIKGILLDRDCWNWILAEDVFEPVKEKICTDTTLKTALDNMRRNGLNQVPVINNSESNTPVGILDTHRIRTIVEERLIKARIPA